HIRRQIFKLAVTSDIRHRRHSVAIGRGNDFAHARSASKPDITAFFYAQANSELDEWPSCVECRDAQLTSWQGCQPREIVVQMQAEIDDMSARFRQVARKVGEQIA